MSELEEVRSRCDELYADLLETQEQLRMEQMKSQNDLTGKRVCTRGESMSELLVKTDCQSVGMRVLIEYRTSCENKDGSSCDLRRKLRLEAWVFLRPFKRLH